MISTTSSTGARGSGRYEIRCPWCLTEGKDIVLETMLLDVIEAVPSDTLLRLPDDLLRRIFSKLPEPTQNALHARLYGQAEETATKGSQDA
jgi:hypothetical protein